MPDFCELARLASELGYGKCEGRMTFEHILPKNLFKGNKKGLRLAYGKYAELFGGTTCLKHNSGNKFADNPEAILFMMRKRLKENPVLMPTAIEDVASTFRYPPKYLRLEYLAPQ